MTPFVGLPMRTQIFPRSGAWAEDTSLRPTDLYQMLAYVTALDLPGGLLVYAQSEATPRDYVVRHSGKRLEVAALDLSGNLGEVLDRVGSIADKIARLRDEALGMARAA